VDERGCKRFIATRPMKGTASRGRTTREDRDRAEWLRNDPKNRAENVMIVDLLRNDLGRLCNYGSVRAESLFAVERYPTLWQMTSTVTGELRPEVGFQQVFRALFPCGSVTGAPKVRAMQLLAAIEQRPRGVYTGAIGFFSKEQTVFNVAIRTLELDGEHGAMGVGGGIVIDSDPAGEFRECLLKAEFLTAAGDRLPERFELLESLLWRRGYPLLELHLDRLIDSAEYFGFACDRQEARSALLNYARSFAGPEPRKVRLLLDPDGELHIENEILPDYEITIPARVRIASRRTDPQDAMLFHKTTHRPLYAEAFQTAIKAGYDDVLFLNQRGEVAEGAIHNIFMEKDGRWLTPPIECGLLAGVQRRRILETQPGVEERVLYPENLRHADAVYLCNAVRGLRRAVIDWEDD
jgi:para-aminobenzoate synthetase/4-amino-4-deoxychorismate lyase